MKKFVSDENLSVSVLMCDTSYFIQGYGIFFFTGHIINIIWKNLPFRHWKEKYFTFCRNTEQ